MHELVVDPSPPLSLVDNVLLGAVGRGLLEHEEVLVHDVHVLLPVLVHRLDAREIGDDLKKT